MLTIRQIRELSGLSHKRLAAAMHLDQTTVARKERKPTVWATALANVVWTAYLEHDPDGWRLAAALQPPKPRRRKV